MATVTPGQFVGPTQAQIKEQQLQRQTQAFQNMDKSLQSALRLKEAQRQFNVEKYFKTMEVAMDEYDGGPQQFMLDKHTGIAKDLSKMFGGGIFGRKMGEKAFQDLLKGRISARQLVKPASTDWLKGDVIAEYNDIVNKNDETFGTTVGEEKEPEVVEPKVSEVPEEDYVYEQAEVITPEPVVEEEVPEPAPVEPPEVTETTQKIPTFPRGLAERTVTTRTTKPAPEREKPAIVPPVKEAEEEAPVEGKAKPLSVQGRVDEEGRFLVTRPGTGEWQNATAIAWDVGNRLAGGDNPDPSLVGRVWKFIAEHTDKAELPEGFDPNSPYATLDKYNPDRSTFHAPKNMEELETWEKSVGVEPPPPVDKDFEKAKFLERFSDMAGLTTGLSGRVEGALDKLSEGKDTSKSEKNMVANAVQKVTFKVREGAAEEGTPRHDELKMYADLLTRLQGDKGKLEDNPALVDLFTTATCLEKRRLSQVDKQLAIDESKLLQNIINEGTRISEWNKTYETQGRQFAESMGLEWAKLNEQSRYHLFLMGQSVVGGEAVQEGFWTKDKLERLVELGKKFRPLELEMLKKFKPRHIPGEIQRFFGTEKGADEKDWTPAYKQYLEWQEMLGDLYMQRAGGGMQTREEAETEGEKAAQAAIDNLPR